MTTPSPEPASTPSFEAALTELTQIVKSLERNEAPLEESLTAYARGLTLLKLCQGQLDAAERKLQILEDGALKNFAPQ